MIGQICCRWSDMWSDKSPQIRRKTAPIIFMLLCLSHQQVIIADLNDYRTIKQQMISSYIAATRGIDLFNKTSWGEKWLMSGCSRWWTWEMRSEMKWWWTDLGTACHSDHITGYKNNHRGIFHIFDRHVGNKNSWTVGKMCWYTATVILCGADVKIQTIVFVWHFCSCRYSWWSINDAPLGDHGGNRTLKKNTKKIQILWQTSETV